MIGGMDVEIGLSQTYSFEGNIQFTSFDHNIDFEKVPVTNKNKAFYKKTFTSIGRIKRLFFNWKFWQKDTEKTALYFTKSSNLI